VAQKSIEISNLKKAFGSVIAVSGLNLEIEKGELFAFLGPNGAGKTTTIKMLVGLLSPTEGQIRIGGIDLKRDNIEVKKKIGYIPDQPFLYDKLTPYEFMHIIGRLYQFERNIVEEKTMLLLTQFDLLGCKDRLIETLSHGMRRRLTFCASLLHEPEVLLIDEPMVGLDPRSGKKFKDSLKTLSQQGVTIFLSTHTLSVAEELADRIGIIHKGNLIAIGSLEHLKERGRNALGLEEAFLALTQEEDGSEGID